MKNLFSNLLILIGALLTVYSASLYFSRINPYRLEFSNVNESYNQLASHNNFPTHIYIKKVDISLPVFSSKIVNNEWETTTKGVSFLTASPLPGNKGNSIFYGHNYTNLLGKLVYVKAGDIIEIEFSDKSRRKFEVISTIEVSPNQVSVLAQTSKRILTIYTCSGFLDSKRFVVTASPILSNT